MKKNLSKEENFYIAVREGKLDEVKLFLSNAFSPNHRFTDLPQIVEFGTNDRGHRIKLTRLLNTQNIQGCEAKSTPLQVAAEAGQIRVVELLLSRGAEIDATDEAGLTALYNGARYGHKDTVKLLLESKADPNKGTTAPIIVATYNNHIEVVKTLISFGANMDLYDTSGKIALVYAATNNHVEVMKLLISSGANINKECTTKGVGVTPLFAAATSPKRCLDTVKLLISAGADLNKPKFITPLHGAIQCRDEVMVKELCTSGADLHLPFQDVTPIFAAVENGYDNIVKILLSFKADPNKGRLKDELSPLHAAASKGYLKIAKMLLEAGADVNRKRIGGSTALFYAIQDGLNEALFSESDSALELAKLLIEHGANVNIPFFGESGACVTPLWFASQHSYEHETLIQLLLSAGANPFIANYGETPLMAARRLGKERVAKLLEESELNWKTHGSKHKQELEETWNQEEKSVIVEELKQTEDEDNKKREDIEKMQQEKKKKANKKKREKRKEKQKLKKKENEGKQMQEEDKDPTSTMDPWFFSLSLVLGTKFPAEENQTCEFKALQTKEISASLKGMRRYSIKYINAFLNTCGGNLYFGVADDATVLGLVLNQQQRDKVRLTVDAAVQSMTPQVDPLLYSVHFMSVRDPASFSDTLLFVVRISVKKGVHPVYLLKTNGVGYIRTNAGITKMDDTTIEQRKKLQDTPIT